MNNPTKSSWSLAKTGTVVALVALAGLGTLFVRIPIPATTGYFNVGDIFVILAGLWLGPSAGFLVGAFGPTAADAIGYPQFILATCVTKGLEGWVAGLVGGKQNRLGRKAVASGCAAIVMVAGYFIFEGFIYPWLGKSIAFFNITTVQAAITELPFNIVQGAIGAAGGFALWNAMKGVSKRPLTLS